MPDAGLSRQVANPGNVMLAEHFSQRPEVLDIRLEKSEILMRIQQIQPCLLEFHIIIGVQVVDPHHMISHFQQRSGEMETDKPG